MASPGRKPKNPQLKVIEGNPGGRPIPAMPDLREMDAEAPDWLDGIAHLVWNRYCADLVGRRMLSDIDKELLAAGCAAWSRFVQATKFINVNGLTDKEGSAYPEVKIAESSAKQARLIFNELGLTPAGRAKGILQGSKGGEEKQHRF